MTARPLYVEYQHQVTGLVHRFDCLTLRHVPAGRLIPVETMDRIDRSSLAGCCHVRAAPQIDSQRLHR